eukprot:539075-Rhodomonas_salina.1
MLPSASWQSEVPWRKGKQGSEEGSEAGCTGAGSEAGGGGCNAGPLAATGDNPNRGQPKPNNKQQLKVTEE